jgi:uncharacterized protein involved in tolerance to divalent cations
MQEFIVMQTTCGSRQEAQRIAALLVEQKLAACVQIGGPIESVYTWQGEQQTSEEWLLTIKTLADRFSAVEQAILAAHSYEQPEILALPIVNVTAGYAQWMRDATK